MIIITKNNPPHLFILLLTLMLSGCVSHQVVTPNDLLVPESMASQPFGYVMGMIGGTNQQPGNGNALKTKLFITHLDDPSGASFLKVLGDGEGPLDFQSDVFEGKIFIAKVPVGNYQINSVHLFGMGSSKNYFLGSRPLDVDFKVTNNTVHYIGAFIAKSHTRKGRFMSKHINTGTGYYRHSYDLKRDQPLAIAKQPELADLTFEPLYKIILQVPMIMPGAPESPTKEQLEKAKQAREQRKVKTDEQETSD